FEGGQMPFFRRIPKRGFSNYAFANNFHVVNVKVLESFCDAGASVDVELLAKAGIVRDAKLPLKVLGEGELTKKLTVTAGKFSESARQKIEAAGGTCTVVEKTKWLRPAKPKKPRAAAPASE
ncbi:MAG: 50S ribosomal protein L15, partial [Phycisphaerales bacterium]|nr:50S ribosomal protein L15 [Phycisphaerales bacterium]